MPSYNPHVSYRTPDWGISSFGNSIAQGITDRAERKKREALEQKLDEEKSKLEHEEYQEFLMRAKALEQNPKKRKLLETKSTGELRGLVQSGLDQLTQEAQRQNIATAKAQAGAATERIDASMQQREQQLQQLQERQDFNRRMNEYGKLGMSPRESFLRAATETGVVDPRQPGAYIPNSPDMHTPDEIGKVAPVGEIPGLYYGASSRGGGRFLQAPAPSTAAGPTSDGLPSLQDQQKAAVRARVGTLQSDIMKLQGERLRGGENTGPDWMVPNWMFGSRSGGIEVREKELQMLLKQYPWLKQELNQSGSQLEGSTAARRFNPATGKLE